MVALCPRTGRSVYAGPQTELAQGQMTDVFGMEAVHVLARIDAMDQAGGIRNTRQRQLHQDAVDRRIGVQAIDQRQQFGF